MEFKGTKGNYNIKDNYIIDINGNIIAEAHLTTEENEYDMLLMSKAPLLIKTLLSVALKIGYSNINKQKIIDEIKNVILDATEIK